MKKQNRNQILRRRKKQQDKACSITSQILSWGFALIFLCLIGFFIYAAIPGIEYYGLNNILFTGNFDLAQDQASVWLPLFVTIFTAFIAILIAGPMGIKSAIFIKFRLSPKYQKSAKIAIELLADIPSVIFGLFASQSLGLVIKAIFGLQTSYNVLTASFMLCFMVLPTIITLSLNALESGDLNLINCSIALGNTKTRAIYKVFKKEIKASLIVGVIIALARAIGETMAVSMILQSQRYDVAFDNGFMYFINQGLRTLGALISANMFAESGGPALQGLLFTFGLILFIIVMLMNAFAMRLTKPKSKSKYSWVSKAEKKIANFVMFIPNQFRIAWESISFRSPHRNDKNLSKYYSDRIQNNKFKTTFTGWKIFWEVVSFTITMAFLVWILGDIFVNGLIGVFSDSSSVFSFAKDSTGQAIVNTILIVVVAIAIGFPLALFIAVYLNEFCQKGKIKKSLLFFIDSLGATPSILFGMFGLIFFIQTLGLSSGGSAGKSLIAGALTILIVILPTFIRTIQQSLNTVPQELRANAYALGSGKWETLRKIVLPGAFRAITTSVVLAIGRILAETAPLYLTSGLASSSATSLTSPGQTLTTRIYAQIYSPEYNSANHIMYECAFVTMILVLLIIIAVHVVIPKYYEYKQSKVVHRKIDDGPKKVKKYKINQNKQKQKQEIKIENSTKNIFYNNYKYNYQYRRWING